MKTSQWRRVVENRCVFSARLSHSPTGPVTVVLVADGSMWLVCSLRNFVVQLQYEQLEQALLTNQARRFRVIDVGM